ncbi:hypothetical protein ELQ92_07490 [Labedella populi]|uniref:Phosphodiesterase n=1 Tax=Labedella populi TaxID=2498850 RepID=A0A3S5CM46_9MICO|nr:hypothetical protein [Labedella populi]RWZ64587.1 hypothetical protein ELQ92_07490 [Labedella populi]
MGGENSENGGLVARSAGWSIAALVRAVRLVRSPRPIHPTGVLLGGTLDPILQRTVRSGIDWIDGPRRLEVGGRLSRGIGTPVPMPDVWGLALRLRDGSDDTGGGLGDILVSSVGNLGVPWRFVPVPRLSPHGARFTTVMPYRSPDGPVLVGARTLAGAPASASARGIAIELARTPWVMELMWATPTGRWRPFATVSLATARMGEDDPAHAADARVDSPDVRFDPVLSPPPGAQTYGWTRALREPAYRVARRG